MTTRDLATAAQWLQLVSFVALAVVALEQWRRRRSTGSAWLAVTFGCVGFVVVVGRFVPQDETGMGIDLVRKLLVIVLGLFPYCLFRFGGAFENRSRLADRVGTGLAVLFTGATLALPRFFEPSDDKPAWYTAYIALFFAQWTALSAMAVWRLWTSRTTLPTVARRRMRTLGAAAALLNISLAVSLGGGSRTDGAAAVVAQLFGLACTLLFVVGFTPPRLLRSIWRRREVAAFRRAETDLMSATTQADVASVVLPHAVDLSGAVGGILTDASLEVLFGHGFDEVAAADLARRLVTLDPHATPFVRGDLVAVRIRSGWLALALPTTSPFLGNDELELLSTLAHFAGLAFERSELSENVRRSLAVLEESKAQLAEAQQTAHLGSFAGDMKTGIVTWSDGMYRVMGYEPDEDLDPPQAILDRVHPDDRDRLIAMRAETAAGNLQPSSDWRILLPSGETRWIQFRSRFTYDRHGAPATIYGTAQDITERKLAEEALRFQLTHDTLTRLPNRSLFVERLRQASDHRDPGAPGLAVLVIDIDRFKWLNDSLGHEIGDETLRLLARRLQRSLRPGDLLARMGGDEFVALSTGVSEVDAIQLAADLSAAAGEPLAVDGGETRLTLSIGVAFSSDRAACDTADGLIRDADAAMERAKDLGRDRVEVFDARNRRDSNIRHETANALRRGIEAGELVVHYQPEVDIASGEVVGLEALVRWQHPERGLLYPDAFITIAEDTGLVVPMGTEVLRIACAQLAEWRAAGHVWATNLSIAVNLAARQLLAPDVCAVVEGALRTHGLTPDALVLEITESVLVEDSGASARALAQLDELGVRIAVDDFGTGFSSLTYLKRFPVDILKIDRSFVDGLGSEGPDRAIVASVVDLAHGFGLTTVAEGVETNEQLAELRALGCEIGQGYLWNRAISGDVFASWMAGRAAEHSDGHVRVVDLTEHKHTILLVEDDRPLRSLLKLIFDGEDDFEVIGETDDGREAVALARHHRPDLVLLDLAMPGMGGLEALPLIRAVAPGTTVVVLSGNDTVERAEQSRRRGAAAFFVKGSDPLTLADQLRPLVAPAG